MVEGGSKLMYLITYFTERKIILDFPLSVSFSLILRFR